MDVTAPAPKAQGKEPNGKEPNGKEPNGKEPNGDADEPHIYKMKDLCDKAGVSRQLVHFYIQQGLLPEGKKTGKNMAYYSEEHLARLLLVRKLQHEQFLPLKAIRALLEERDDAYSPAQRKHMREVRAALPESLTGPRGPRPTVSVDDMLARLGVPRADLDEMVEAGLLAVAEEQDMASGRRRTVIATDDAWLIEHYAALRAAGLTPERGFSARHLAIYDDAVQRLVAREARLIAEKADGLTPAEVADFVERALPIVGSLLSRLHAARAKNFFATL